MLVFQLVTSSHDVIFNGIQSAYCDQLIVLIVWFLDGSNHGIALGLVLVGFLIDSKTR